MTHKLAKHLLKYSVAAKLHTHHTKKLHFISTVYLVNDNSHHDSYSLERVSNIWDIFNWIKMIFLYCIIIVILCKQLVPWTTWYNNIEIEVYVECRMNWIISCRITLHIHFFWLFGKMQHVPLHYHCCCYYYNYHCVCSFE